MTLHGNIVLGQRLTHPLPGMSLNYPEIKTASFLTSLASLHWSTSLHHCSHISVYYQMFSVFFSYKSNNRSLNEHWIISESIYLPEICCVRFVSWGFLISVCICFLLFFSCMFSHCCDCILHVNFTSKCQQRGSGWVWYCHSPGADVPKTRGSMNK